MKMTLTSDEKQTLLAQHATTRDGRVRDRIKSVIHVKADLGDEPILFMDATHPTQATKVSCG